MFNTQIKLDKPLWNKKVYELFTNEKAYMRQVNLLTFADSRTDTKNIPKGEGEWFSMLYTPWPWICTPIVVTAELLLLLLLFLSDLIKFKEPFF